MSPFGFQPDAAQARALEGAVRRSFSDSLDHIVEECDGRLSYDFGRLQTLRDAARRGERLPCSSFGLYTDLVAALTAGDETASLALLAALEQERPLSNAWRVLPIDAAEHALHRERLLRLMGGDDAGDFRMRPPPADVALAFTARLARARARLQRAIPELAAEIETLVTDVILVAGDHQAAYQFDGGSCYMLWGGLFLNATSHETEVAVIEVLAHETAHMLLYACAVDEALVDNDDDELFPSPLRHDPRPMDGIYHATFVSARMHWAMSRLLASGVLDAAEAETAQRARDADQLNFWAGHGVVREHGLLTATGRQVMDAALGYMRQAAPA